MAQQNERFSRALQRLVAETLALEADQMVLESMVGISAVSVVRIIYSALHTDRLQRFVRILEDSTRTASIWYLLRCDPKGFSEAFDASDIEQLKDLSSRLKPIRDRVFVHIDKDGVLDPQQTYRDAGIRGEELQWAIATIKSGLINLAKYQKVPCQNPDTDAVSLLRAQIEDFVHLANKIRNHI